jgi:hypothetical protein
MNSLGNGPMPGAVQPGGLSKEQIQNVYQVRSLLK